MTSNVTKEYLIRDAFRKFYPAYAESHPKITASQRKVAECIMKCKTGELGYNLSRHPLKKSGKQNGIRS